MRSERGGRRQMNKEAKIVAPYTKDACKGHITSN